MSSERLKISNFTYIHTYILKNMYELLVERTDGRTDGWQASGLNWEISKYWRSGGAKHIYWGYHKKDRRTLSGQTDSQPAKKTDGQTLERTDRHTNIRRVFSNSGSCCALL